MRNAQLMKKESPDQKRDWRTYEQRLAERLKTAYKELKGLSKKSQQVTS